MISKALSEVVSQLSVELGIAISAEKIVSGNKTYYELRFTEIVPQQSFHLILARSFRSTSVTVKPDFFAREAFEYVMSQVIAKASELKSYIDENRSLISSIEILLDGKPYDDELLWSNQVPNHLLLEVDVLTPTSSLEHGLLSPREAGLLRFSVELLLILLPKNLSRFRSPDEVIGFPEGAKVQVTVNRYERDPRNRDRAIAIHGESCMGCGFNFKAGYGEIGAGYIVVHHTVPVSEIGPNYVIDPSTDLVPLCANCHAMVHTQVPPLSVSELRTRLRDNYLS